MLELFSGDKQCFARSFFFHGKPVMEAITQNKLVENAESSNFRFVEIVDEINLKGNKKIKFTIKGGKGTIREGMYFKREKTTKYNHYFHIISVGKWIICVPQENLEVIEIE